jgi:hypothetical protein
VEGLQEALASRPSGAFAFPTNFTFVGPLEHPFSQGEGQAPTQAHQR